MIGNKESKTISSEDELTYGTHTLPRQFWTKKEGTNLLNDPAYKKRREEKKARHDQNRAEKAEKNKRK